MAKLEIFWDVGSPYTYMATTQLEAIRERTGAEIVAHPFLLGGVFKATENHMPAMIPAKARYMLDDLHRWAARYGVPFSMPSVFPINSLAPMRVACAFEDEAEAQRYMHVVMRAHWAEGIDVGNPDELAGVLKSGGFDAERLIAATKDQAIKDRLRANTEEAVARGAFGAPAIFVGEALFWGNDRLAFVEAALK